MTDRSVKVNLTARVEGFVAGIRTAQKAASDFTDKMSKQAVSNKESFEQAGRAVGGIGLAASGAALLAIKSFADFDQSMSDVAAATHAPQEELAALRQAAIKAGADTKYSATEAAGGIENLAKAGVSTTDILNGGLNGALALAAAGGMDVADSAETAATALVQFKLKGSDVPHVADLLAAAAGKAQGEVSDMSMALKQGGLVAAQAGLSIEETTGTLAAFAAAGLLGSDAGTSLKTMLLRLQNPSAQAASLMSDLGISAYDVNGNFVSMQTLAGELQDKLGGLSEEQRNAALATIFGSDAIRAASVLYSEGAAGIQSWTSKVNDQGYAAETAAIKMDNLKGDLEQLSGSFETAMIGLGESSNGPLRSLIEKLTDLVNGFNDLDPATKNAVLVILTIVGALGTAGGAMLLLLPKIAQTREAMKTLHFSFRNVTRFLTGPWGAAFAVATIVLGDWINQKLDAVAAVREYTDALERDSGALGDNTREAVKNRLETQGVLEAAQKMGLNLKDVTDAALGNADALGRVNEGLTLYGESLAGNPNADQFIGDIDKVRDAIGGQNDAVNQAIEAFHRKQAADGDLARGSANAAEYQKGLTTQVQATSRAADQEKLSLDDLKAAITGLTTPTFDLRSAQRDLQAAYDDATASIKENGRTLDIGTEKGRANQAALDAIAQSANGLTEAMYENGASNEALQANVDSSRAKFVALATQMGMSKAEAQALAEKLIAIPEQKSTTVKTPGLPTAIKDLDTFLTKVYGFPTSKTFTLKFETSGYAATAQAAKNANYWDSRHAAGGYITGPGTGTSDSIPSMLSNGEFVVRAAAVRAVGVPFLSAVNRGGVPSVSSGEVVQRLDDVVSRLDVLTEVAAGAPGETGAHFASALADNSRRSQRQMRQGAGR